MKYVLFDTLNIFARAQYVIKEKDEDLKYGFIAHLFFSMIKKVNDKFKPDKIVFCCDSRSWRKEVYSSYKLNRVKSVKEQEDNKKTWELFEDMINFIDRDTNSIVLRCNLAEADDLISIFTEVNKDDQHIIISGDSDLIQLISSNVSMYDGIKDIHITEDSVLDSKNNPIKFTISSDGKISIDPKKPGQYDKITKDVIEYCLFCKCIRGDRSDNIPASYPGVSLKGSSKRLGLKQAFDDRHSQGYNWINFMNHKWVDHNQKDRKVEDVYNFNKSLIDLKQIPEEYRNSFIECINNISKEKKTMIGIKLIKFFYKYNLSDLEKQVAAFSEVFSK